MNNRLYSLTIPPPAGFKCCGEFRSQDLLISPFVLYSPSDESAQQFLGALLPRLAGIIMIPGERFSCEDITPMLTAMTIPPVMLPALADFAGHQLRLLERPDSDEGRKAMRASEERFKALVDNSIDVIFVLDTSGNFRFVSPAWEKHFGYPAGDVIGRPFAPFVHQDDVMPCLEYLMRIIATGEAATSPPYRVKHSDGSWSLFIANGSLYRDEDGDDLYLGIGRDISGQVKAEEERLKMERQLLHTQKLESLGVLAGGIAHDFNNILTSIIGNADLALMRISQDSPASENLRRIEKAAAQAADLARQMLAYSGKGMFVIEQLNLNRMLEEMLHMLEVSISKKAVLRMRPDPSLPPVDADASQIRQVVMNLVINASEAIGDRSGFITITTECREFTGGELKDNWTDDTLSEGMYVYLEIADNGCGMDETTLSRIFDPFFTTKFTGRGLGMAAVLGIIKGHKGAIRISSEQGGGSSFRILLPASGAHFEPTPGQPPKDNWKGSGTVLLVDDEEQVRKIGSEMLRELGFTVITADNGRDALDIFRQNRDISFVILDLTMPHMDGGQCFWELRRIRPDLRVIMSSGYNEHEVTRKFTGSGLAGFIQKPYRFSALKEVIRNMGAA